MTLFDDEQAYPAQARRRERLRDYVAAPLWLRSTLTPMIRPQTVVDPTLAGAILLSFLLHLLPLFLLWLWQPDLYHGASKAMDEPQVEMMFDSPSVSHDQAPEAGGGAPVAPSPSLEHEASSTPVVPTPQAPSSTEASHAAADDGVMDVVASPHLVSPAIPRHTQRDHAALQASRKTMPGGNNPFPRPMDWSFNGQPFPQSQPRRHGRRGSKGGSVDLSLGPLSMNGQINAPYRTRSTIKGVSSDYGSEIDRWIRAHMFYPEQAAHAGEEGPASVHVVIDRNGHVRSVRLTVQSGSYALDAATAGMFQGVALPPVPPDMSGDHFDLDVTINYILIRH